MGKLVCIERRLLCNETACLRQAPSVSSPTSPPESALTAPVLPSSSSTLDRLGSTLRELLETVDGLKARGIHLVNLEERLDTSSVAGELVFHVFGAIAHFEGWLISERTRDGIAAARRCGRKPGRPPLDPETVSAVQKLIEAGLSPAQAAKHGIDRATAYRLAAAMREGASSHLT